MEKLDTQCSHLRATNPTRQASTVLVAVWPISLTT